MASYGFVTSSSSKNSDGSSKANDPYAGLSGTGGIPADQLYQGHSSADPYAGLSGTGASQSGGSAFSNPYPYPNPDGGAPTYDPGFLGPLASQGDGGHGENGRTWETAYGSGAAGNGAQYQPTKAPALSQYQPMGQAEGIVAPTDWNNSMDAWQDSGVREAMMAYAQAGLPLQQAMNNQFNQNREYDFNSWLQQEQLGQTQWRDTNANNLAWGGLSLQQQLAQDASNQWGSEFKYQQGRDSRSDWESDRGYNFNVTQADREYGLEQSAQEIDQAYRQGLISNEQRANEIKALEQQSDSAYQQGMLGVNQSNSQTQALAQQATAAYQQGQLSLGQYEAEMARLSQEENLAQRYEQLRSGETISREQMDNAYKTAVMNAVGRNQAQNVRFMRG